MKTTNVGLAEGRASNNPEEVLTAIGLGSCVAVVMYDPGEQVGGLVHVMLPRGIGADGSPAKFAETAVPYLTGLLVDKGADPGRLRVGLFGGSTLLTQGQSALLEIGQRNAEAVGAALTKAGLTAAVTDVGGTKGRTVQLAISTGLVTIKVLGESDRIHNELSRASEVQR